MPSLRHAFPDPDLSLPAWVPDDVKNYLEHTCNGHSLRSIARSLQVHASTILRQVRKYESLRDDPLIDAGLDRLANKFFHDPLTKENNTMKMNRSVVDTLSDENITREARRVLRRLCEHNTYLLVSPKMEKAAVFKEVVAGRQTRLSVTPREVAEAFALKDWIACDKVGNVSRYVITATGRKALKRMLAEDRMTRDSATTVFQEQHKVFGERVVRSFDGSGRADSLRFNLAESPLTLLARKKDAHGVEYLSPELLEAGERFRADFERAQLGPRVAQNWDRFLTGATSTGALNASEGAAAAHEQVSSALHALGPGLGDIVLRVCCFLEGMEKAEKRLGWAARSGKVVLKIALQRLALHYGITKPQEQHQRAS